VKRKGATNRIDGVVQVWLYMIGKWIGKQVRSQKSWNCDSRGTLKV